MLGEILFLIGVIIIGGIGLVTVFLYLIFKKNLTMRLWVGLVPGIGLIVINTFIWTRLGGFENLPLTFTPAQNLPLQQTYHSNTKHRHTNYGPIFHSQIISNSA